MVQNKKIVLVTGGTSGIGLGTVQYLLEQGCYEVISYSHSPQGRNYASALETLGEDARKVTFLFGDISCEEDCVHLAQTLEKDFGHLDGLVNCAGMIKLGGIEEQTVEEWDRSIRINLTGVFLMVRSLLPLLKKGTNPSIVNISSMASERPGGSVAYSAAKAGVDVMSKYLAMELGKYNIRVNTVNPAAVYTNIYVTSGDYTQESYDQWSEDKKKFYPLGRIGDAKKDLAPMIEFLLSDKSLWTTGGRYLVDGGKSI